MTTALQTLWREARKLKGFSKGGNRLSGRKALPPLLFLTDPLRTPDPAGVLGHLPKGAGIVFRAFGASDAFAQGRRLAALARRRRVLFFVGADAPLAIALRADGLHLPERKAFRPGWNRRLAGRFIITAAVHGPSAIRRARGAAVDAIVLSPVFPSDSPSAGRPMGPRRFAVLSRRSALPVYALGGVNALNVRRLHRSGATGVAAVSGLIGR
jgi:thiamine-phosphate pyrophosphorylase